MILRTYRPDIILAWLHDNAEPSSRWHRPTSRYPTLRAIHSLNLDLTDDDAILFRMAFPEIEPDARGIMWQDVPCRDPRC